MKALKTLLVIVLAIVAIVIVLGLIGPSEYRVERSITIPAETGVVWANVSDLEDHEEWSPWAEKDPDMAVTITGDAGQVGQKSEWKGDENVGSGYQQIAMVEENKAVRTDLHFIEPWESQSTATFDLEDLGDSTRVTWGIEGENNFMGKVMSVFMDMDKMVGPDFERGLANLKEVSTADQATLDAERAKMVDGFTIETMERPGMTYVGVRKTIPWSDMEKFFGNSFGKVFGALGQAGVQPQGAPTALYFMWDEENKRTDVLAGAAVSDADAAKFTGTAGMSTYAVAPGNAYVIDYFGGYAGSGAAHMAMDKKIKRDGASMREVAIEEYITDPGQEPDSSKWHTRIVYPIQ